MTVRTKTLLWVGFLGNKWMGSPEVCRLELRKSPIGGPPTQPVVWPCPLASAGAGT